MNQPAGLPPGHFHRQSATGTAMAQSRSYGFLGGVGVGNAR
ncbi:hypothetical protein [Sphingomonas sp. BK036]|nr:hypothetical protein [Sphingomonas sp. BK036]